jgi:hypothetical protein
LIEHALRPEREDLPRRPAHVVDARELPRLLVVDDEQVDAREQRFERTARLGDPVIHRVEPDEPCAAELVEHALLERRIDVAEEDVRRRSDRVAHARREAGEHAEVERDRVALVHVLVIAAVPAERLAAPLLEPRAVDAAAHEVVARRTGEVVADRRDEVTGRRSSPRRRSASRTRRARRRRARPASRACRTRRTR